MSWPPTCRPSPTTPRSSGLASRSTSGRSAGARRSWKKGVLVALLAGSAVGLVMSVLHDEGDRVRTALIAANQLEEGKQSLRRDDFATASARFDEVVRLTSRQPDLRGLHLQATVQNHKARETGQIRSQADAFSQAIASLRFHLIGVDGRLEDAEVEMKTLLAPFRVLDDVQWTRRPELTFLDPARKRRLIREVDEVLFLYVAGLDPRNPRASRQGVDLCKRALAFTDDPKPWVALRDWLSDSAVGSIGEDHHAEGSAKSCYEWGVLFDKQGLASASRVWLTQATWLEKDRAWYRYHLATILLRSGDASRSILHYEAALAVEKTNRRFWLDQAKALRSIGERDRAKENEERAASLADRRVFP